MGNNNEEEKITVGEVLHDANTAPQADDKDHYASVTNIEYVEETNQTKFLFSNYYLQPDGTKLEKGSQEKYFDGKLTPEEVVVKAQSDLIEPGWNLKVVLE